MTDLAQLLTSTPIQVVRYGQGTLISWNPDTFENVVEWQGVQLHDLPVLGGVDALSMTGGDTIGMLGWDAGGMKATTQWWIIGRMAPPPLTDPVKIIGGDLIVAEGGSIELRDRGAVIVKHDNGQVGAVYGNFAAIGTGGAEDGHGLLVQANNGDDIFRAKQADDGGKLVFIGASTSGGAPLPVRTFRSRALFAGVHTHDGPNTGDGQFRVEADTDIVLNPQSPSGSQGVWISHATTGASANCVIGAGGLITRSTSSLRYKQDIEDHYVDPGLMLSLEPKSFRDKNEVENNPDTTNRHVGLIAEEVDELGLSEFVTYNDDGEPDSVAYDRLAVGLLEVVKQQQVQIDALTEWASQRDFTKPDPPERERRNVKSVPKRVEPPRPQEEI